jgi:uncharacterized protein (UPF0276 family)
MEPTTTRSLGYGVGLRAEHYDDFLAGRPDVDWIEAITENYVDTGGRPLRVLERLRRDLPVALHGIALSIGSVDPLDGSYLASLRALVRRLEPVLVTDHLCWTGVGGRSLFDLLPLPLTEEALAHVVERTRAVQDLLGRRILLENPSTYFAYRHSTIPEWEFLAELAERADCGLLLDVNNVWVSAFNLGFDPIAYLDALPVGRVGQIHLAGFTDRGSYLFDTHSAPVHERVWDLYEHAVERFGAVATLVEWDADIPSVERLSAEAARARQIAESVDARRSAPGHPAARGPIRAELARDPGVARGRDPLELRRELAHL